MRLGVVRGLRRITTTVAAATFLTVSLSGCAAALLLIPLADSGAGPSCGCSTSDPGSSTAGSGSDSSTGPGIGSGDSDQIPRALPPVPAGMARDPSVAPGTDRDLRWENLQIQPYTRGDLGFYDGVEKSVGEPAELYDSTGVTPLATVVLTGLVFDPLCTNHPAHKPSNGHYIEVQLSVQTTAALGTSGMPPWIALGPGAWFASVPGWNGGSGAEGDDDRCDLPDAALPSTIGPSQNVRGYVLLDVTEPSNVLMLIPNDAQGYDWLFTRPATWTETAPPVPAG